MQQDGAHEDVEGAATDEGEEKGGVARDLRGDLELEKTGGLEAREGIVSAMRGPRETRQEGGGELTETEDDHVDTNDDGLAVEGELGSSGYSALCPVDSR